MKRRTRITLGIDEAGRGPSMGPMVMAAVALDSRAAAALTRAGLRDSKAFGAGEDAHQIRCELSALIRERAAFVTSVEIEHTEIDQRVVRGELNVLEREYAARMIEQAPEVDKIIADGKRMFQALCHRFPQFESRDRAEDHHASVAAASVIAKTIRDSRFAAIRERYETEFGPIAGNGYVNAGTRKFIRAYAERYGKLPDETRRSWPHLYLEDLLGDVRLPGPQLDLLT